MRRSASVAVVTAAFLLLSCDNGPTGPDVGAVQIAVSGLPAGATANITLRSETGSAIAVGATGMLEDVPSGRYTVVIAAVEHEQDIYDAPPVTELQVRRRRTVATAVTYGLVSGAVDFSVSGLPPGVSGSLMLSGPGGAVRSAQVPGVVRGLLAGAWTVTAGESHVDGHRFAAAAVPAINVGASATPVPAAVTYTLASGTLRVSFTGLPPGVNPRAVLFGPTGRIGVLTADTLLRGLVPGVHTVAPEAVFDTDIEYRGTNLQASLVPDTLPQMLTPQYTPRTGRLRFNVTGLPSDVEPRVRVLGAGGYNVLVSATDTLRSVPAGPVVVQGAVVGNANAAYAAGDAVDAVVVGAATAEIPLQYAETPGFDPEIAVAYFVQSVQTPERSVPLVPARTALLRVFPRASLPNAFQPSLRVRLTRNGMPVLDTLLPPFRGDVPTAVNEGNLLTGGWRLDLPATLVQPGLAAELTLDPTEQVPDANRANNLLALPADVRPLGAFRARFVPIQFAQTGQTGNITQATANAFLLPTREMLPVGDIDYDIRAPFVTAEAPLTSSNSATWGSILGALNTVQVAEGTGRYYMGIVPVTYNSGIAGIGYVPGYTTLTWDYLPSGGGTLAHELGHNLGRRHAPCGGPSGVDPNYPFADANIGHWGYRSVQGLLVPPTAKDLMSYCSDEWISAYTFNGMLSHRQAREPALSQAAAAPAEDVLLVSGRIEDGRVTLEPTYSLSTRPLLPSGGPHSLLLQDAGGRTLYTASFAALPVSHVEGDLAHFTFAIPRRMLGAEPTAFRVASAGGGTAEWRLPAQPTLRVDGEAIATREADGRVTVSWSDPAVRGLMVRDAASGTVLSIVRGDRITLPATNAELTVLASDGLRTTVDRVRPAPR